MIKVMAKLQLWSKYLGCNSLYTGSNCNSIYYLSLENLFFFIVLLSGCCSQDEKDWKSVCHEDSQQMGNAEESWGPDTNTYPQKPTIMSMYKKI